MRPFKYSDAVRQAAWERVRARLAPELLPFFPSEVAEYSLFWHLAQAAREVGRREVVAALAADRDLPAEMEESVREALREMGRS